MRHYRLYLRDILEAMEAIEEFIQGMDFEQFKQDDRTASAVIRKFEIIGEAAKGIPEEIKQEYPQIPWKEMAGMRDRLIHAYFNINHELVWKTIKRRVPVASRLICQLLDELGADTKP